MRKSKQLVFIDDSGDPGFKNGVSSSNFVLAAALFLDPKTATLVNNTISEYRRSIGWRDEAEFKFRKTNKQIIKQLLQLVCKHNFQIYAIYLDKPNLPNKLKLFIKNEDFYNFTTKSLLQLMPLEQATVKIDGKYDKQYRYYIRAFIRRELNLESRKIADFDALDSKKDNLIQLADLIAGSIHRSLQTEKTDASQYLSIIKPKIALLKNLGIHDDETKN